MSNFSEDSDMSIKSCSFTIAFQLFTILGKKNSNTEGVARILSNEKSKDNWSKTINENIMLTQTAVKLIPHATNLGYSKYKGDSVIFTHLNPELSAEWEKMKVYYP